MTFSRTIGLYFLQHHVPTHTMMFLNNVWKLLLLFILISAVNSDFSDDEHGDPNTTPDPEDEWHMDFVPTGYLPDSVYRELAWYGILQIQPLYHSTKHKVAARWIWQNTLGRPYVILEDSPQSTISDKVSHESLVEESAKWGREQRSAVDVLMENIRTGGNGLTVRTVISLTKKTVYIIQNGKYYECEAGSEPDMEAFRTQANMHQRKCTYDKEPKQLPFDICMDAEFAQLDYSFRDGWAFCLGDGERDSVYAEDGDLDCGQKQKVLFSQFLEDCAIDNNVVISFDYFGDEPRKDLIHNVTICTTWDPCKFAYLYRIESLPQPPELPTTTPDPCDTTVCPECEEGFSEEPLYFEPDDSLTEPFADAITWVSIKYDDFPKYKDKALAASKNIYIIRAKYRNMTLVGKLVNGKEAIIGFQNIEVKVNGSFELAVPKDPARIKWVQGTSDFYDNAIPVGMDGSGSASYLCRAKVDGYLLPGRFYKQGQMCLVTHHKQVQKHDFEVLVSDPANP